MRVLGDIPHPLFKVTLFAWNGKYLLKLEKGSLEQTFKLDELDFTEEEVKSLVTHEGFMQSAEARFQDMGKAMGQALQDLT